MFSLQDFVSVAQWIFSSSGKTFSLSFCLSFPPPPFFSDSIFLSLSSFLSAPSSTFLVSSLSRFLCSPRPSLYQSLCLYVLSSPLLPSLFLSYVLSLSPSFFRWPPLSAFLLPSQDASLQGMLHQNGTATEREEGVGSHVCNVTVLLWREQTLLLWRHLCGQDCVCLLSFFLMMMMFDF